jgi:hypothetical protein
MSRSKDMRASGARIVVAAVVAQAMACTGASGQCCDELPVAVHDSTQQLLLGTSVDFIVVSGNLTAVAGAPLDDTSGIDMGSSTLLNCTACGAFTFGTLLFPSDGASQDMFGASVAMGPVPGEGHLVLVGSPQHNTQGVSDAGAV